MRLEISVSPGSIVSARTEPFHASSVNASSAAPRCADETGIQPSECSPEALANSEKRSMSAPPAAAARRSPSVAPEISDATMPSPRASSSAITPVSAPAP
jgi:hypothetical protein